MAMFWYCHRMATGKPTKGKVDSRHGVIRRKADNERRESVIKVLATVEEKEAWTTAARADGTTVSTWLRQLAIRASKKGTTGEPQ
jgi:hypothetical protein